MIIVDKAQRELDAAREQYRQDYNWGYSLSQRGYDEEAQRILDAANREYDAAKAAFARERAA